MFVGHRVTADGVSPDPDKIRAIMEMPEPTGVEGVRRVMDALSRAPVKHTLTQEEKDNEADVKVFVDAVVQSLPATEARLKVIQENQKTDPICAELIKYCHMEWPEKHALPPELGPYWPERENLSLSGELLLRSQRIVIPYCMRQGILRDLHSGHQGIVKCRSCQSVWWPGLSVHISHLVKTAAPAHSTDQNRESPATYSSAR
ncbi:hypothetical protein SRHO_G00146190 [Serrasalmus rhombeus]